MISPQIEFHQKKLEVKSELTFVEYIDHFENGNLTLSKKEIKEKVENPITLKSFGHIVHENERFLVIENFYPRKIDFIFKPAIISQESYSKVEKKKEKVILK